MPPVAELASDPALERLLQIMAIIKLFAFAVVLRALWWRLQHPISRARRATYALGVVFMATAVVLLVTNVSVAMVPFLFESTVVLLAMFSLSDRELHRALTRQFPDPDRDNRADAAADAIEVVGFAGDETRVTSSRT